LPQYCRCASEEKELAEIKWTMEVQYTEGTARTDPTLTVSRKGAGGYVRAHGCGLTGKMTGAVDQVSDCASVITLI
jgi:hypothetical protein